MRSIDPPDKKYRRLPSLKEENQISGPISSLCGGKTYVITSYSIHYTKLYEDFFDNERDQNGAYRYQHDGYDVKTVVIGKNVTKFKMFVLGEEFFPTSMRIEEGSYNFV